MAPRSPGPGAEVFLPFPGNPMVDGGWATTGSHNWRFSRADNARYNFMSNWQRDNAGEVVGGIF